MGSGKGRARRQTEVLSAFSASEAPRASEHQPCLVASLRRSSAVENALALPWDRNFRHSSPALRWLLFWQRSVCRGPVQHAPQRVDAECAAGPHPMRQAGPMVMFRTSQTLRQSHRGLLSQASFLESQQVSKMPRFYTNPRPETRPKYGDRPCLFLYLRAP